MQSRQPRVTKDANGSYLLTATLVLGRPIHDVFRFFSEATNLDSITPPWLRFKILTPQPIAMQGGTLIDYSLHLHSFPVKWRSRIEDWKPDEGFIDVQVKGPFKYWRHEHRFRPLEDGRTLVEDQVKYRVPGGWPIHRLFVRRDLLRIFNYRQRKTLEILA